MNSSSQRRSTRAVRPRPRSSKVGDTSTPARGALSNSKLGPGARTMEPNWTGKGKATGNVPRPVPSRSLSPATSPLASSGATGPFNECSKAILYISVSSGGAVSLLLLPPPPSPFGPPLMETLCFRERLNTNNNLREYPVFSKKI